MARSGEMVWVGDFRKAQEMGGLDAGDGASIGEGGGNVGGGDIVGELGDGEDVVGARGEKEGVDCAAEAFDGRADSSEAVIGITNEMSPTVGGVTDLIAVEGHGAPIFGKGARRGSG